MADKQLSAVTAASALAEAELFYIMQGANTRKATGTQLKTYTGGGAPWYLANAPTAASMTLASGDATNLTLTDDANVGLLFDAGTAVTGDKCRFAEKTIATPTADWTWTVRLDGITTSAAYSGLAISCRDATSGRLITLGYEQSGSIVGNRLTALAGPWVSSALAVIVMAAHKPQWFRIKYLSGTDVLEFYVSVDGKQWTRLGTETRTTFLTNRPDRVGFGAIYNRTSGANIVGNIGYAVLS